MDTVEAPSMRAGLGHTSLPSYGASASFTASRTRYDPSDLQDLLGEHQEAVAAATKEKARVKGESVLRITRYESRERPQDRWRGHRTRLGVRDEVSGDGGGFGGEPLFTIADRDRLQPPQDESFRQALSPDFTAARNMRSFVQVLTTPTADTPGTTLMLHFDDKRYLIGSLGEGTQRATVQMGARLLKVNECFLTGRTEWSNTGGLIGMILTLADAAASSKSASTEDARKKAMAKARKLGVLEDAEKVREVEQEMLQGLPTNVLTLFSPPNLNHTLATARRFVFRKGMPVSVHEIPSEHENETGENGAKAYWADSNIKVWPMSILPESSPGSRPTSQSHSISPRKRSIEEVYEGETSNGSQPVIADDLTPTERDQLTVKAVVGEMFNSSWRLDTLFPTRLTDVKMPATIFVRDQTTHKIEKYRGLTPGGRLPLPDPDLQVLVRKPWPGALVETLPPTLPAKEAVSYIIRNHKQRGKFFPEKAKALKVPVGRAWSQLQSGESVENTDGEMVHPDQVLGPSKEGGGFAVVDLPDSDYIANLIARPEWQNESIMAGVGAIVWICGPGVATDERLRTFMSDAMGKLQHVVSSPDYCPNNVALDSAAAATVRLRQVDDRHYRVPTYDNTCVAQSPLPSNAQAAVRGQLVQLEPAMEVQNKQNVPLLDVEAVEGETSTDVLDEAARARESVSSDSAAIESWAATLPDRNVEITTLGTGSALPSKYRNVSATLMRVPGWGNLLFDCGENTLGQLRRVFPPDEMRQVLQDLRAVTISHMHADHHLGTVGVLKAWYTQVHSATPSPPPSLDTDLHALFTPDQNRLAILAEPAMLHWLSEYAAVEDFGFSRIAPLSVGAAFPAKNQASKMNWFIPPSDLAAMTARNRSARFANNHISPSLLGLSDVQAVLVQHCHGARAISITWPNGFKASYSGDCRPSAAFSKIGKGSTVVIHEATFDDELQGDAEAKNHSTTSEALGVAQAMGAKCCVLTHFSQRYQKLPVLEYANGSGGELEEDLPMLEAAAPEEAEDHRDTDEDDELIGADAAADAQTYADQPTSASNGDGGQTYALPPKVAPKPSNVTTTSAASPFAPSAVKFKLQSDMKVCVAFDYMRVKLGEIAEMQHYTPALLKLFEEDKDQPEHVVAANGAAKKKANGAANGGVKKSKGERKSG
ncbi:hypothetical protein B0A48_16513 [Cryoendolithus antarcticus]|uniref:ribonuclease Z n=1 Tax=Cryoendolithus antarcticus TaxID=1507870 RepID=A0A1V8SEY7_9PEZI|nr:hypothetical protein B0A48_16513 [Cryoendolithus antarcticus]